MPKIAMVIYLVQELRHPSMRRKAFEMKRLVALLEVGTGKCGHNTGFPFYGRSMLLLVLPIRDHHIIGTLVTFLID